jgi:hypothetical protein
MLGKHAWVHFSFPDHTLQVIRDEIWGESISYWPDYWKYYAATHSRIYARATGARARAQGGKFPGAAY